MKNDCLFCAIAAGEIPSKEIFSDELIYCFADINPQAKVHVLVIPREHIASADGVNASNSAVVAHIFEKIPEIAAKCGLKNGYRIISNCGPDACQSVRHLHFHILGGEQLAERMA